MILTLSWEGNTIPGNANVYARVIKFLKVELDILFWVFALTNAVEDAFLSSPF